MDEAGTTQALTTLSPILPERMRELTSRLRVVRYTPGLGRPLLQLGFIHYARWIIVEWLPPRTGNGGWHGLRWKYLLFEGNYDGSAGEYFRAFSDILPARLIGLWGDCVGFERAALRRHRGGAPSVQPSGFQTFIDSNSLEILTRFAAFPGSTAIDIRQAVTLNELEAEASREPRNARSARAALQRKSEARETALGPVSPTLTVRERFSALYDPWKQALSGHYGVNPLTVVTPLSGERADALREASRRRPLDGLNGTETHFARLSIIPPWLTDLGQPNPDRLDTAYLLYTSDSWGQPYDHIETVRTKLGATADLMWGECDGYPGHDERAKARFHAWVNSHTLKTRYYVAGYPPRSVAKIHRYLEQRARAAERYAAERAAAGQLRAGADNDRD